MAVINTNLVCELQNAVKVQYLDGVLFSQDVQANRINVTVLDNGEAATISGTVSADIIRADGGTVVATGGTISENVASITLPAAAYYVPGVVSIVVKLTSSGVVTTIAAVVTNIYQSSTDTSIDPGTIIPSVQTLITSINTAVASIPADYSSLWTKLAPAFSTDTSYVAGQYVTYNSGLYMFTTPHTGAWASGDVVAVNIGGELTSLKSKISALNTALDMPLNISQTGKTAYQSANIIEGLSLKKGVQYTVTFAYKTPGSAVNSTIYCRLKDSSDNQLGVTTINQSTTSGSFTYTPTQNLTGCYTRTTISAVGAANQEIVCTVVANSDNKVTVLERKTDDAYGLIDDITGYKKPNLFNNEWQTATANNVTYTTNDDKSITIYSTGASAAGARQQQITLQKGKYILSGCNNGGSQTYSLILKRTGLSDLYQNSGVEKTFEITADSETVTLMLWVGSGAVVDDTVYPMIRYADVYNSTYVPYGEYQIYKPIQELIDYTQFNWSGKKMNVIGDSIVQGSYGNFVNVIRDILCLSEARNYGVGGSCLASSDQDSQYTPAVLRYSSMDLDAQIIIVHAGTNDYSAQIPLGADNSTDITTFNGALNVMMSGLRDMYPTALIIFDSILHRFNDGALTIKASEYRQCIENRCLANHIVFYDCYKYSGFDFVKGYYDHILTSDGLHPNQTGANILGRKLAGFINWN